MKKIIGITICLFIGYYGNAQSAKQDKEKIATDDKARSQVILPSAKAETGITQTSGGVSSQSYQVTASPLYETQRSSQEAKELQKNDLRTPAIKKTK